ncbi:MAG: hypothetical protein HY909_27595 [Deltaproteobacteria bacterium]|nr:hypothetical protein [Deltaproteobacteria bacterium]
MERIDNHLALGALALLGAVLCAGEARGQGVPTRVRIEPPACTEGPFDGRGWLTLLASELHTDGVDAVDIAPAPEAPGTMAVVRVDAPSCRPDLTEVQLTVDDLLTHKSVRRTLSLEDLPTSARPRAVALAAAELLRASWAELGLPDSPVAPSAVPPAVRRAMLLRLAPAVREVSGPSPPRAEEPQRWRASGALEALVFPGQSGAVLGARASATRRLWDRLPLVLRADLGGAYGLAFDRSGEIDVVLVSLGASLQLVTGSEALGLSLGPRVELGWAWVQGRLAEVTEGGAPTVRALSGNSPVLLVGGAATLRSALSSRWSAVLELTVGQTVRGVRISSSGQQVSGLEGPSLSLGVGLSRSW